MGVLMMTDPLAPSHVGAPVDDAGAVGFDVCAVDVVALPTPSFSEQPVWWCERPEIDLPLARVQRRNQSVVEEIRAV